MRRDLAGRTKTLAMLALLHECDTQNAQLHQTRTLGAHLLASALHHLLAA